MLQIIILVLKILGIVILAILGILVLTLAAVLLVPVRYKAKLIKNNELMDDYNAFVRLSWLLGIIYFRIKYINGKVVYTLKIFGVSADKLIENYVFGVGDGISKNKRRVKNKTNKVKKMRNSSDQDGYDNKELIKTDNNEQTKIEELMSAEQDNITDNHTKEDNSQRRENHDYNEQQYSEHVKDEHKKGFFAKIINSIKAITELPSIIKDILFTISRIIRRILRDINNLIDKVKMVLDFFSFNENKDGISKIQDSLKSSFKHIKPSKYKFYIKFGTGDPAATGQLLGLIAMTNGIHRDIVNIRPDFNEKIFEADLFMRGRIRLLNLIIIYYKLYFSNEFKRLTVNFNRLKEDI